MTVRERDTIVEFTRTIYSTQGCEFPSDDREMVEYLYDSEHPSELSCLRLAIMAHNLYKSDSLTEDDFFEWHGL